MSDMVELLEQGIKTVGRQSSKGNQLKWEKDGIWYKADYAGYEGLAEYMVSSLLLYSNLAGEEYVSYQTEEVLYKNNKYRACKSGNFLPGGWRLITLERLFQNIYGKSLYKSILSIGDNTDRMRFLAEQTERITGLKEFGIYLSKLITIDAVFLNEDRHTHNIAVLQDDMGGYHYCPVFDNGAALLSDTSMDYPMDGNLADLMKDVKPGIICRDFDEQLDCVEKLYGQHIRFCFGGKEIGQLSEAEAYYPVAIKQRVQFILLEQRRKYQYLFL